MKVKLLLSFLLLVGCCLCAAPADRVKTPPARQAWDAYIMSYWLPEKAQFRLHKGREDKLLDFWFAAHAWDAIIDASLKFKDARTKAMVPAFYDAFMKRYPDWKTNHFNDDILWWTISCTYAYRHTHDKRYLEQAKTMFDWLCEKEIDDTLGGGMWWKNSEHKSKNACNNFPAVCAIPSASRRSSTSTRRWSSASRRGGSDAVSGVRFLIACRRSGTRPVSVL